MRIGKLDNDELQRLILDHFSSVRSESLTVPRIGEDCASLDIGDDYIVLSSDPITSAGISQLGRLSVYVNCNDVICCGADPVGLMVTLLAPPDITADKLDSIARDLAKSAADCNVDILGGHTEITDAVTRVITSTTVIARQNRNSSLAGAKVGDDIVMTKYAALEGTGIIGSDYAKLLADLPEETIIACADCLKLLSIAKEGRLAMKHGAHAMHDVTEGGVLGAAWELAARGGLGAVIDLRAIPVLPQTAAVCSKFGLDPFRLIGSGSLLIACENGELLCNALLAEGINAAIIGRATDGGFTDADGNNLQPPAADELYKII